MGDVVEAGMHTEKTVTLFELQCRSTVTMIWVPPYQLLWTRLIKTSSRVWVQNKNNNVSAGHLIVPTGPSGDCHCSIKVLLVNLPIYYRNLNCYNNYVLLGNNWSVCKAANI